MPRKTIVAILAASLQALVPVAAIAQTPATSTVVNTYAFTRFDQAAFFSI